MDQKEHLDGLIREHYGSVWRAALALSGDRWEADEIAQDTFLAALDGWSRFRGESSVATWLHGICLRMHRSRVRRASRHLRRLLRWAEGRERDEDVDPRTPEFWATVGEDASELWQAVQRLPVPQREAIVLRYYHALPLREAAELVGCAEGTMKTRLYHATRKLRGALARKRAVETRPRSGAAVAQEGASGRKATPESVA